jgi:hypothetical protein
MTWIKTISTMLSNAWKGLCPNVTNTFLILLVVQYFGAGIMFLVQKKPWHALYWFCLMGVTVAVLNMK